MRRHMQNISFAAIIGMLLSCAYFFSQQTRSPQRQPEDLALEQADLKAVSLSDLPECDQIEDVNEEETCYANAAALSEQLLIVRIDEVLALIPDTAQRVAFLNLQDSWEENRDADCDFLSALPAEPTQGQMKVSICLEEQNLARYAQLGDLLCELDPDSCMDAETARP